MLTEIGSLVGIVKGLMDVAEKTRGIFAGKDNTAEVLADKLKSRIGGLAEQLRGCNQFIQLPEWRREFGRINYRQQTLPEPAIPQMDRDLRDLVHAAKGDHFSSLFYTSTYAGMKAIDDNINFFRREIDKLDSLLNSMPYLDSHIWAAQWPAIRTILQQVDQETGVIEGAQHQTMDLLISELSQASKT